MRQPARTHVLEGQGTCAQVVRIAALILGFVVLGSTLWAARYGFDFTDEGFYLNWLANPAAYPAAITQFGFIYHPLHAWLGGDIVLLRQANILLTVVAGWWFASSVLRHLAMPDARSTGFVLAIASLSLFALWLPTPSYNSLALLALLITATGLLNAERWGWLAIGLGGWLAFMAKPPTAAMLAVLMLLYIMATRSMGWRKCVYAGATALAVLLASAILIAGSVTAFIARIQAGLQDSETLLGKQSILHAFRIDTFSLGTMEWVVLGLTTGATLAALFLPRRSCIVGGVVLLIGTAMVLHIVPVFDYHAFLGLAYLGPLIAAAIYYPVQRKRPAKSTLALAGLLFALPHVYAFGTISNYWSSGVGAGVFWLLAAVVLLPRHALAIGSIGIAVTVLLLTIAMAHPYRQPQPLFAQQGSFGDLRLPQQTADYLAQLKTRADRNGFTRGVPILDMSGQSPGIVYLLGAASPGTAWTLGGYAGSEKLLQQKLDAVPCDTLARAWILTEPKGSRALPLKLLRPYGMHIGNYSKLGPVTVPANGELAARVQYLYKPRAEKIVGQACTRGRK